MDNKIIRCICGHVEWESNGMWLNGGPYCRACYKDRYRGFYGKPYKWEDLDNPSPPTEEMYKKQKENFLNEISLKKGKVETWDLEL